MAEFKTETLSEIHIGSGQILTKNIDFDFDYRKNEDNENDAIIGVFDINKIFKIIGQSNIEKLISFIEKKDKSSFVKFVNDYSSKNIKLSQISKRTFCVYGENFINYNFLKEQLINSNGFPIIPGSSLKGAIRTAIISYLVEKDISKVKEIVDKEKTFKTLNDLKKLETKIVNMLLSGTEGFEANKNIMRFFNVSDIEFQYETIGIIMEIANLFNQGWDIKKGQKVILEVIPKGCESEVFRLNINSSLLNENVKFKKIITNTEFLTNWDSLFSIINTHTKKLIENELIFWENQNYSILDSKIEQYKFNLERIYNDFKQLKNNEMIIRIGGNSGWDSITGGWAKEVFNESEWNHIYRKLNKDRDVEVFPKTRKIGSEGELMGYLKLIKI